MPRHQRLQSKTGTYHVMMRGNEKKNLFLDEADKQRFLDILFARKKETGLLVYAYCLMDNHVHLLIKVVSDGLATIMKRINTSYAYYFNQKYQRVGHLFQDRFKSEPVEDEKYLLAAIRYIHNNPVRAKLVEKAEHYKWSSFSIYLDPDMLEAKMVDTEFILSIIADDRKTAIREFIVFSQVQDESKFLDIEEDSIWTLEEGESYLKDYLTKRWSGKRMEELISNKNTRTEIIMDLKTNTRLSGRTIAVLLGINRGIVQRVNVSREPSP
jgi:putative transposase